jgi:hypothetical protein
MIAAATTKMMATIPAKPALERPPNDSAGDEL